MAKDNFIKEEETIVDDEFEFNAEPEVLIDNIIGTFETVDAVPTAVPTSVVNQIKIYKSGATKRLYWYDGVNNEWSYAAGT